MHTIAAKAVALKEALSPEFKKYAQKVIDNARALSASLQTLGLSVVSGGTDSHIVLVDLRPAGATGKEVQECLDKVHITGNKNTIPYDPQPPTICSGFRLGTPALTTRGMGEGEMKMIAQLIFEAVQHKSDDKKLSTIRDSVKDLSSKFPLYAHRLVKE